MIVMEMVVEVNIVVIMVDSGRIFAYIDSISVQ